MFQNVVDCCQPINEKAFKPLLCVVEALLSLLFLVCIRTAEILLAKPFLECFKQHFSGGPSRDFVIEKFAPCSAEGAGRKTPGN